MKPKISQLNAITNEMTVFEMTDSDHKQYLLDEKAWKAEVAEQEANERVRQSALAKLAPLGLSPEEISAITGA